MYPNLYYLVKDWFGIEVNGLKLFNSFGIITALAFFFGTYFLSRELKRKEKEGFILPWKETKTVKKQTSFFDFLIAGIIGFLFGFKMIGAFLVMDSPGIDLKEFTFSASGSWIGGLFIASLLIFIRYTDRIKKGLAVTGKRSLTTWPHERIGVIVLLAVIFGFLGAKIFDNLENWNRFIENPISNLFSPSGLTFYGGLIFATIAIGIYGVRKGVHFWHGADSFAPALMIAYAIGRMGCQVSGDGDWGIYNSAYFSDQPGHVIETKPDNKLGTVTYTIFPNDSLARAPHAYFKGPGFLPNWMFAYTYPHNVEEDGIQFPNCEGEYCRVLPQPVFPTPLYEFIMCTFLFLILWVLRKSIRIPGYLTAIYLLFNGFERFLIERIRVNTTYNFLGIHPTQGQIISLLIFTTGLILLPVLKRS